MRHSRLVILSALLSTLLVAPSVGAANPNKLAGTLPTGLKAGPVITALWLRGKEPKESAGGPFVYLFAGTAPVTCADALKAPKRPNTLVMEIVIGSTKPSTKALAVHADPPGAGYVYATFLKSAGGFSKETPATSGSVTLTGYQAAKAGKGTVTGTFHLASKSFDVSGAFNALWCDSPQEI